MIAEDIHPSAPDRAFPLEGGVGRAVAVVKPGMRGWLHAGAFPLALVGGAVLVALARSAGAVVACSVYAVSALLLFGTSAVYHRGDWGPRGKQSCDGWTMRTSS